MATNNTVNNGVNKIDQTISTASDINSAELQNLGDTITNAIQNLGDGLKLNAKDTSNQREENDTKFEGLKNELEGLRVFAPELADIADLLLGINVNLDTISGNTSPENLREQVAASQQETDQEEDGSNINIDARASQDLAGLTNLVDIAGTGFALVGNLLSDLSTLFTTVLEGVAAGQIAQALVNATNPVTQNEINNQANENQQQATRGVLASFFQGLAGPLESIASGMLLLSVSLAILNTIQLSSDLLATIIVLQTFMLTTFGALAAINIAYQAVRQYFDLTGEEDGSIVNIIKQFAAMVAITAGTLLACGLIVNVIQENWQNTLLGLVVIFGTAFVTLAALSVLSVAMNGLIGEEAPINQMIKSFAILVGTVAALALICGLFYDTIVAGMELASSIFTTVFVMLATLSVMIIAIGEAVDAEQLQRFQSILTTVTVILGLIAVLTIVLGLLPQEIVMQGIISVGIIVALLDSILIMLTVAISRVENIDQGNLQALMGILITTTVLIGLIGVLVIVLGTLDPVQLITGLAAMVLIAAIPIVLINVMAKVGEQTDKLAQALIGTAIAAVITLAVTGVAWIILNALSGFETSQILASMLAVTLTTALIMVVAVAAIGMGALAPYLIAASAMALATLGIASVFSLAISGLAYLLATILQPDVAQGAIIASQAIMLTTLALIVVATGAITLAALAIPLTIASPLALIAISILGVFLTNFANNLVVTITTVTDTLAELDISVFATIIAQIGEVIVSLTALSTALLAFNLIATLLTVQVYTASIQLAAVNLGMLLFSLSYRSLTNTLNNLPETEFDLGTLTNAIENLSAFSEAVNNFVAPSATQMLAVSVAMSFVSTFAKRLGRIGTDDTIERINNLTNSLSALANTASGLTELASALQSVSAATQELNEVQQNTRSINIEALSGQAINQSNPIQRIERVPEANNNEVNQENVNRIIELLQGMSNGITNLQTSMQDLADTQDKLSRRGDTSPAAMYMQDMD